MSPAGVSGGDELGSGCLRLALIFGVVVEAVDFWEAANFLAAADATVAVFLVLEGGRASPERVGGLRFGGIAFVGVDWSEERNCACSDVCSDGYYGTIIYTDTSNRGGGYYGAMNDNL